MAEILRGVFTAQSFPWHHLLSKLHVPSSSAILSYRFLSKPRARNAKCIVSYLGNEAKSTMRVMRRTKNPILVNDSRVACPPPQLISISLFLVKPLRLFYRRANTEGRGCQVRESAPYCSSCPGLYAARSALARRPPPGVPGTPAGNPAARVRAVARAGRRLRGLSLLPSAVTFSDPAP